MSTRSPTEPRQGFRVIDDVPSNRPLAWIRAAVIADDRRGRRGGRATGRRGWCARRMLGHARNGVVRESLERAGAQMISKVSYPHSRRRARSHAAAASLSRLPPPPGIVELPTIALRHGSFRLLRPSFPASDWSFTDLGTPASLGRPARIVRVRRRGGAVDRGAGHWPGLDDHECVVDDALRIPLRITGRVGSRDAVDHAATKLHVDAALGGETFSIRPAESTRAVVVQRYGA